MYPEIQMFKSEEKGFMERWISALSKCPIFRNLSEKEIIRAFRDISYITEKFEKGRVIYREGKHRDG